MREELKGLDSAERRQGIANLLARGIMRMKEANIILAPTAKPSDPSLSKPPRSIKQRVSG